MRSKAGRAEDAFLLAGEKPHRLLRAPHIDEMRFGDSAAALTLRQGQSDREIPRQPFGHARAPSTISAAKGEEFDYGWEERWIRDEGYSKIVPAAIKALLEKTGAKAADIAHFILPCPFAKLDQTIAKQAGIDPAKTRDNLAAVVGDTGSTHSLLMLVAALEDAKPGEKILVVQFGQGCDALLFEATREISEVKRSGVKAALARRKEETNYMKYLAFNGLIELEKGMRAEIDKRTALTTCNIERATCCSASSACKCRQCGSEQFPRSRICVNPNCKAFDSQDPYGFSELNASVLSWSADSLTYSMDPPNHYGMVTFAEGGRLMADITDVEQGQVDTGMKVRMAFRIKDFDEKRGFRRYFWKAVPA